MLGDGIVDGEGIGFCGLDNGDAYHRFKLEGGVIPVIVRVLIEVGN